jgi:exopolysaccharide production protein ExoQ
MTPATAQFGRFSGHIPDLAPVCAGAALVALAVEPIVGTLAALAFLACGLFPISLRPDMAGRDLLAFRWLLLLPAVCMASVLWSEAPGASLRAGVQLFLTFVIAILVARRLSPGALLSGLILVLAAIVALSVATGSYRSDTGALTGYFASKNAMGAASALLAVAAAGQVGRPGRRGSYRAGGALALLLGAGGVVLSQSMGALVAMSIGLCTYPVLSVLRRLSLRLQVVVCIACVSLAGFVIVLLIANIDAVSAAILAATGKDITLTGRTDLWRVGLEQIAERPWLGQGYQAFWQPGNPEAEHLWRAFGIESRTGFHFHNLYLSNAVEIGIPGAALQAVFLVVLGLSTLRLALGSVDYRAATLLAMTVMVLAMTPLEVPAFFPFNLQTFILVATMVYARDGLAALRGASAVGIGGRRVRG